ncbi:MAG: LemA family protein [Chitinophagaceae bacterium]|nr:LemA family protein [Chitinophagaceae bacterium]
MSTSAILLIALGIGVFILIAAFIKIYNELAKERILTQEGASGVGTCLQQRNDLIPNLVETVKGYAGHENQTLIEVTKWRNQSAAATTVEEQNAASGGLKQALMNMLSITEAYPELKANENFQQLMGQLSVLEEKINDARRYYSGTVREYNQSLAVFPKNMVGNSFGFKPAVFFAEDAEAKVAPKVKF